MTFGLLRVDAEPDRNRVAAAAVAAPEHRVAAPEPNPNAYLQQGGHEMTEADFFEMDVPPGWWPQCKLCGKGADGNHVRSRMHLDRIKHPWDFLVYDTRLKNMCDGLKSTDGSDGSHGSERG